MFQRNKLLAWSLIQPPEFSASFSEVLSRSRQFEKMIGRARPTKDNWMESMCKREYQEEELMGLMRGAYPVVHERVLVLMEEFLEYKKKKGTKAEKEVYRDMDVIGLMHRLIKKRPLAFLNESDDYTLRNGQEGSLDWDTVGSEKQKSRIPMKEYMTYDEVKLAALIQISSPILPINSGSRDNVGLVSDPHEHVWNAFYVGAVGSRFERKDPKPRMECQEILVTKEQNTKENGYGQEAPPSLKSVFAKFYGFPCLPSYKECSDGKVDSTLIKMHGDIWFNCGIYLQRMEISAETFLIEAEKRGMDLDQFVYVHCVGLGLGVWVQDADLQRSIFLEAFQNVIKRNKFQKIRAIHFSKKAPFPHCKFVENEEFPGTNIEIKFGRRDPFGTLDGEYRDMLIVALYAWDGNAFPGNEYWNGALSASGDPAAACCSQIPEVQNAYINSENVCGSNLRVVSSKYGLLHIGKYAKKLLDER